MNQDPTLGFYQNGYSVFLKETDLSLLTESAKTLNINPQPVKYRTEPFEDIKQIRLNAVGI